MKNKILDVERLQTPEGECTYSILVENEDGDRFTIEFHPPTSMDEAIKIAEDYVDF